MQGVIVVLDVKVDRLQGRSRLAGDQICEDGRIKRGYSRQEIGETDGATFHLQATPSLSRRSGIEEIVAGEFSLRLVDVSHPLEEMGIEQREAHVGVEQYHSIGLIDECIDEQGEIFDADIDTHQVVMGAICHEQISEYMY